MLSIRAICARLILLWNKCASNVRELGQDGTGLDRTRQDYVIKRNGTHAHMYSFMYDLDLRIFAHGNLCHDVWSFGARRFISK